ncbi:MAG: helicase-exonuclease AddAB subunit AddA [Clostridiales Family XIII bacterium]|jgi:ATP-dependent helicase/nuclease subunit A|nr:helicase-exonuclease AddAB subunit AddA [Clostridiales Family XIII bacterium]
MLTWTDEQALAIGLRNCNILVSAAAGSGKTAVLVERIKALITDENAPVRLDRMLVVTFTEAAASEMRRKIVDAVSAELEQRDSAFLREQLRRIFAASISTFHSFALGILKRYYYIIDMEPSFKICDEFRKPLLVKEALDTLFDEYFERGDPDFTDFLNRYAGAKNENAVRGMIADTHTFIQSLPDPFGWLRRRTAALSGDPGEFAGSDAFRGLLAAIVRELEAIMSAIERLGRLLEEADIPSLAQKNDADLAQAADLARAARSELADAAPDGAPGAAAGFDALGGKIRDFSFARFVCAKADKENYEPIKLLVTKRRDRVKAGLKKLAGRFFAGPFAGMVREIGDTGRAAQKLCELTCRFDELFSEIKRREGLLDFNDIEHMALRILDDARVRAEYRDKFDYIFIDEYQDSNLIQESLVSAIKRADNLFMVGDVKQSIYKFRLAEPELFIGKYNDAFSDAEGALNRRIDLNRNFRSKRSILNNINAVFAHLMDPGLSGIVYDEKAALCPGLSYDGAWDRPVALWLVDTNRDAEDAEPDPSILELRDAELEALAAARIIRDATANGATFFDTKTGTERALRYRDIVILLGEAGNTGSVYYETLMNENIPAFVESGDGYFDTVEMETFLNLLRVIDNLRQDVALVGTICSPVFGFSSDDLIRIRLERKEGAFYQAFLACAQSAARGRAEERREETGREAGDAAPGRRAGVALRQKCAQVLRRLETWRHDGMFMELSDFLWKLMKESGYYDYAGALPGGVRRRANLRALADRAEAFQTDRARGLFGFICYIDSIRSQKVPAGQVKLLSESDDAVRIMTIHKSKGLEFPMVIVGQMGRKLRGNDDGGRIDLHKDIGIALRREDYVRHSYKKTLLQRMIAYRKEREKRAEAVRVLYVAMTRAMDRLVLLGVSKKAAVLAAEADLLEPDADTDVMGAGSYLDMILPLLRESRTETEVIALTELRRGRNADGPGSDGSAAAGSSDPALNVSSAPDPAKMLAALDAEPRGGLYGTVEKRLLHRYPFAAALSVKSKYSVSELNREARPARYFMTGSTEESMEDMGVLSAAERGSALHKALEKLDYPEAFARRGEAEYFERFLRDLVRDGVLTAEQRDAAPAAALQCYARTEIFARAAGSRKLRREIPFTLKWRKRGEPVIVQGVIDCFFEEAGKIVLIDFKSGRSDPDRADEKKRLIDLYGAQIDLYRRALESILGLAVDEAYLYLINVGKTVAVPRFGKPAEA